MQKQWVNDHIEGDVMRYNVNGLEIGVVHRFNTGFSVRIYLPPHHNVGFSERFFTSEQNAIEAVERALDTFLTRMKGE